MSDATTTQPPSRKRRIKRAVKWTVAAIILFFVGRYIWNLYQTTDFGDDLVFRVGPALLASVALLGMYCSILLSEWFLLDAFTKRRLPLRWMPSVTWVPLLGKFVPGKVASVAGATYVLKKAGVPAMIALSVFVLLDALPVLVGAMASGALLMEPAVQEKLPGAPVLFGIVIVGGLVALSPPVLRTMIQTALRLMRRDPLPHTPTLRDYGMPLLCACGQWITNAAAVGFMCAAFAPAGQGPGLADFPRLVGITALVMCASYFGSFITPQGFGVREALFIPLLATIVPAPAAAAATLGLRVLHIALELLLAGLGLVLLRQLQPSDDAESSAAVMPTSSASSSM